MCGYRSEASQSMNGFRMKAQVRQVLHGGTYICEQVTGPDRSKRPMVDVYPVRCGRGDLVSIERGIGLRQHCPRVRVGGGFAGEVSRFEFGDSGLEVVRIEYDVRRDSLVGIDLDD